MLYIFEKLIYLQKKVSSVIEVMIHYILAQSFQLSEKVSNVNPLDIGNIMMLGMIIGGIIGFFHLIVNLGDRLWKKGTKAEYDNEHIEKVLTVYSESIKVLISQQLEQLHKQNETIKEMITSFRTTAEDSKLRHEIIMNNLRTSEKSDDNLHRKLDKITERLLFANKKNNNSINED
jgi:hypothetical protein